jgi:hypothetical protein
MGLKKFVKKIGKAVEKVVKVVDPVKAVVNKVIKPVAKKAEKAVVRPIGKGLKAVEKVTIRPLGKALGINKNLKKRKEEQSQEEGKSAAQELDAIAKSEDAKPTVAPQMDDASVEEAKRMARLKQRMRQGRASTILSDRKY